MLLKISRNFEVLRDPAKKLCKKDDCEGIVLMDEKKMQCQLCQQLYCLKCQDYLHKGKCDKEVAFKLERKHQFRRCPSCKVVVQRIEGCDHMTCVCGNHYCYRCGCTIDQRLGHSCKVPEHLGYFAKLRWKIERTSAGSNDALSFLLRKLEPQEDRSAVVKGLYLTVFSLILYPLLIALIPVLIALALTTVLLYICICILAIILFFLLLPLFEIKYLQLSTSHCLMDKGVPKILVRTLIIFLYPVNLLIGIKEKRSSLHFNTSDTCETFVEVC